MKSFASILTAILLLSVSSHSLHTMEPEEKSPFSYNKFLFYTDGIPMLFPISDNSMIFRISADGKSIFIPTYTEAQMKIFENMYGKNADNNITQILMKYNANNKLFMEYNFDPEQIQESIRIVGKLLN